MTTTENEEATLLARLDEAISKWDRLARRNRIYKSATQVFWGCALLASAFLLLGV